MARGYNQDENINYDEIFASIIRLMTITILLAFTSYKDFKPF